MTKWPPWEPVLTGEDRAAIRADVWSRPPLTDEHLDALADFIAESWLSYKPTSADSVGTSSTDPVKT